MSPALLWLPFSFLFLFFLQRWIHRHLRGLALLLTGREGWAIALYALVLFPGVLLHEFSHWLTAGLLGVRTGKFSVWPKVQPDGSLQLGYVEYYKTKSLGPIRESLIGAAPLLWGITAILLISRLVFDVPSLVGSAELQSLSWQNLILGFQNIFKTADSMLWLYLLFTISNAMMPSASDRRAWPGFIIVVGTILIFLTLVIRFLELTPVFIGGFSTSLITIANLLTLVTTVIIVVDLVFAICIFLLEIVTGKIRNQRIRY